MPKKDTRAQGGGAASGGQGTGEQGLAASQFRAPGTTGRYLVLFKRGAEKAGVQALSKRAGIAMASMADYEATATSVGLGIEGDGGLYFDSLGVAVVDTPPQTIQSLSLSLTDDNPILAVEPERIVYALDDVVSVGAVVYPPTHAATATGFSTGDYLRGYRDAVNHIVDKVLKSGGVAGPSEEALAAAASNETELTWGLQVTNVANSKFSGKGIKIAVLDTGLDLGHPDFVGRAILSSSFVPGEPVQDGHGHGTHCVGTACGPQRPGTLPRYGIAYDADIYVGKVLSDTGSGTDSSILAGIDWAMKNGCSVVSMSLGAPVAPGLGYSQIYEQVAKRALAAGTLLIAAAGNESHRPGTIAPVDHPANCPSIMAVGALDSQLQVGYFSNGGINPQGGQVDVAAPGVQIRSSWPRPTLYNTISGTSMATPHAAGISGLLAEANPQARGAALWTLLVQAARRLSIPSRDVGTGLVQSP